MEEGFLYLSQYEAWKVKDGAEFPLYSLTGVHLNPGAFNAASGDEKKQGWKKYYLLAIWVKVPMKQRKST